MIVKPDKKNLVILIIFLIFMAIVTAVYIATPNNMKKLKTPKSFEEMLEYNSNKKLPNNLEAYKQTKDFYKDDYKNIPTMPPQYIPTEVPEYQSTTPAAPNKQKTETDYGNLLNEISEFPTRTEDQVQQIVNKLLVYKDYPPYTVKVVATEIDQSRAKTHENYMVANFDFSSGDLRISPKMLYQLSNKELIAILAHELDHFDKLANTCKSMGTSAFTKLFYDNGIQINSSYWDRVSKLASDNKFDAKLYQDALKRFITQNDIERTSSYSDFYRLAENMRNPLETNAYKESDFVYNHYGIPQQDGPIKKLAMKFNDVDWAVYNATSKINNIEKERIALFDYFFSKAIVGLLAQYDKEYQNCIINKQGDLTSFWLAYERSVNSFYQRGALMDNDTYNIIYSLLEKTENLAKQSITPNEIALALKMKINTLDSNLVYPTATKNMRMTLVDYLRYIKENNITDDKQELKSIIKLICIDNDLTKSNENQEISLFNLKLPEEIKSLYNIGESKKGRFLFIYNNPEFKSLKNEGITEQKLLENLINENRLDIRIQR